MPFRSGRLAKAVRAAQIAVTVFTVAAIAVVAVVTFHLQRELRFYVEAPVDNAQWNITQLELDAVRLQAEAEVLQSAAGEPLTELRQRFDLFYSRAQSVIQGRAFEQLEVKTAVDQLNRSLEDFLTRTQPSMDGSDAELRAALPGIVSDINGLRQYLRATSVEFVQQGAKLDDIRRRNFVSLVWSSLWAAGLVIVSLVLLLFLIQWLNRLAQRRSEETIRISSRLGATVSTSLDAIIVADAACRIIDYNEAAHMIFGYTPQEAIGMDFAKLIDRRALREACDMSINRASLPARLGNGRIETEARRKSGEEFPVELSMASNPSDEGMIHIAYLRDISSRRAAEASLLAARDAALAADHAKTNFLAVMSHEMRTPLNGVLASLEILSDMTPTKEQQRFLSLAKSSADQVLRHVNDVLDLSKIDAGNIFITKEPFNLVNQVEDMVATFRQAARARETELRVNVLSSVPMVIGDSLRFGQILQNLISNATKFTPHGTVTVEVEVISRKGSELSVEVRVVDTGIGIAEADQERIFGEFIMVDPSYRRTDGGTGLGLAISRRLAAAMGGEIGVESEPGEGSCFWFRLPFAIAEDSIVLERTDRPSKSSKSLDILLVEDNAINRIVLEEMLTQLGHRVTMAEDGKQGLDKANQRRFDVILMDISMPNMDGVTATRMIRAGGPSAKSQIVALTAHSLPSDLERFRAAGMEACLTKPVSRADLAKHLGKTNVARSAVPCSGNLLDVNRLSELSQALGPDGRSRILTLFRKDMEDLPARIIAACQLGDSETAGALAHAGAGAAATVGATRLQLHLATAEDLCLGGQLAEVLNMVQGQTEAICQETFREISLTLMPASDHPMH